MSDARNVPAHASGHTPTITLRDKYLDWVEQTERTLLAVADDPMVTGMLRTERYWHIREL
ncbi:MAG: hypothetical protein JWN65_2728 [Solirubrobacterales bacterium]|nr:hypothetical protein [Solirubrobacterales bacterium]